MGLLQSPDPSIKLARQYGIRGLFTPEIVPSLQPVVLIDDLTGDDLTNVPSRIASGSIDVVGVLGEITVVRFETPPNTIARIFQVRIKPETSTDIQLHYGASAVAPATFVAGVFTDGRLRSKGEIPAARIGGDTVAVAPTPRNYTLPGQQTRALTPLMDVNFVIGRTDAFDFLEFWQGETDKDWQFDIMWEEFTAAIVK